MSDAADIRLPRGARDLLPRAAARRKRIAQELLAHFRLNGYEHIITPLFEVADVLERGLGDRARAAAIRFVEPGSGEVVALRPDITPQIARIASTRASAASGPLRYCYDGMVSRAGRRGSRELLQCGAELIGASGPSADAETALTAGRALARVTDGPFLLELGHVALVRSLLAAADSDVVGPLEEALSEKDKSAVARLTANMPPKQRDLARSLFDLAGPPSEVFRRLEALPLESSVEDELTQFKETIAHVEAALPQNAMLSLDLGEVRGFGYYTGIRFFGYVPSLGHAVLVGGRYDELVGKFGAGAPAIGFSVDVEALAIAEAQAGTRSTRPREGVLVVCDDSEWDAAHRLALGIQDKGMRAAVLGRTSGDAEAHAVEAGFRGILDLADAGHRRLLDSEELAQAKIDDILNAANAVGAEDGL